MSVPFAWCDSASPKHFRSIRVNRSPPPEFSEPISEVRERVRKLVGKVTSPRDFSKAHRHIAKLLEADEERRQKQLASRYPSSFDAPFFESPFERRRLRLLNAIAVALERCGMKCTLRGKNPSDAEVRVGKELVTIALDHPGDERKGYWPTSDANRPASDKLQLRISSHRALKDVQALWERVPSLVEKRAPRGAIETFMRIHQTEFDPILQAYALSRPSVEVR